MMKRIKFAFLIPLAAVAVVVCCVGTVSAEERLLGSVVIERSMMQSGGAAVGELSVTPGRHDGANLIVDRAKTDELALYLSRGGRDAFASQLRKLQEWGEAAEREKIDAIKAVGTVSAQSEFGRGSAVIATRFISSRSGASWLGQIRFCQLPAAIEQPSGESGAKLCEQDRSFYLSPAETARLIEILGNRAEVPVK